MQSSISGIMSQDVLILKEQRQEKDEMLKKKTKNEGCGLHAHYDRATSVQESRAATYFE